jgi:2-polyprenyl-3-methyl-5-hydroxy-6-metoxy-1,4-benzoquinol methylase
MEYICCNLCGANEAHLVFKRKDLTYCISDEEFCVVRCRKCGLVYVNSRPTREEIHSYYPQEFYDTHTDPERLLREKERQLVLKYEYVKDMTPGRLLDIGPSKGEFMYFLQEKGWHVHGVEFSNKPPNLFNLDIFYGDLKAAGHRPQSFDLITLWGVLEHVYDPRGMLQDAANLLKDDGKIVILVTNFNSLPARFMRHDDVPRHTTLFTKHTMRKMLQLVGLKVENVYFNSELFGGSNRGILNYIMKLFAGEKIEAIVAMNRTRSRWHEFSSQIRGKHSRMMLKVDNIDIAITPYLDRLLDNLQFGLIMIVKARKEHSWQRYTT